MSTEAIWLIPPEKDGCLICHQDHKVTPETHPEAWEDANGVLNVRAAERQDANGEQQ
jgi:hypothetical protein